MVHHADRGVQHRAIRYTQRLEEADAVASVGSKGDSYDYALAGESRGFRRLRLLNTRDIQF